MTTVTFRVAGVPAPQGSKTPFGTEANPRTRPWRAAVSAEAALAMRDRPPITGPVALDVEFFFTRPKSHYGSGRNSETLKAGAPFWVAKKPDVDKLVRAVADSLTGIVVVDDAQVACLEVSKSYAPQAGATIQVRELS